MKKNLLFLFMAVFFTACQDSSKLVISDLQCEYLDAPLAIDNTTPHFGWKMTGGQKGTSSSAYQLLVATELDKLNEEEADLWNSGKVSSDTSIGISYGGKALTSRTQAYWKGRDPGFPKRSPDGCGCFRHRSDSSPECYEQMQSSA